VRLLILAVGRLKAGPERALFEHYAGRIRPPLEVVELEARRAASADERIRLEAELIAAAVPAGGRLIALDAAGEALRSEAFAARIERLGAGGAPAIAFAIGGADGLAAALTRQAELVLSFGRATWPHFLVRAMLAEQIYRAQTIRAGHPYHRGH